MSSFSMTKDSQPFAPVAGTRHQIESNGWLWRKRPRRGDTTGAAGLAREASVLNALGVWVHHDPRGPVLTTVTMGSPVDRLDAAFLRGAVAALRGYAKAEVPCSLRPVEQLVGEARTEVLELLGSDRPIAAICLEALDGLGRCTGTRRGLLHTDPVPEHWVSGDRDTPALIGWGHAAVGPREVDLAALVHWLTVQGRTELIPIAEGSVKNWAAFRWGLTLTAARDLARVTATHGDSSGWARQQRVSGLLMGFEAEAA